MEKITLIEKQAQENLKLAQHEKEVLKKLKLMAKSEIQRAKARQILLKNEYNVSKLKLDLAEEKKKLAEEKNKIKNGGILQFSDEELKMEQDYAIFHEKVSKVEKQKADINKKIVSIEKEIAENRLKLTKEKMDVAKAREILGKKQFGYVKLVKSKTTDEKTSKAEKEYLKQKEKLDKQKLDVLEKEKDIKKLENKLADYKKEISVKLSEREKIRHPGIILSD